MKPSGTVTSLRDGGPAPPRPVRTDVPLAPWSHRDAWLATLLLAVLAGSVCFFGLGTYRTLGSHEAFAAVPAREMLATGDWIVPRFGGLPRLEKPPLSYWVVAASGAVFGEVNEWTARLPAALSALVLATLIGWWAARWYGPATGFATAFAQLTALYAITFGRKAEVDMLLWLCMTGALCLVALQPIEESRGRAFCRWIGVYALLSLTWLAKFHYGPVLVLAPTVTFYIIQRRYRSLVQLANPVGLLLFAAAIVAWPHFVVKEVPQAWEVWRQQTLGRAIGDMGRQPVWYYLPHVLWLALPWTPLAVAAVPASWRRAWSEADARERFLWVWLVVQLAVVSASANKHKHYVVPALPVVSFLAGRALAGIVERYRCATWRLTRGPALLLGTAAIVAGAVGAVVLAAIWPELLVPGVAAGAGDREVVDDDEMLAVGAGLPHEVDAFAAVDLDEVDARAFGERERVEEGRVMAADLFGVAEEEEAPERLKLPPRRLRVARQPGSVERGSYIGFAGGRGVEKVRRNL